MYTFDLAVENVYRINKIELTQSFFLCGISVIVWYLPYYFVHEIVSLNTKGLASEKNVASAISYKMNLEIHVEISAKFR